MNITDDPRPETLTDILATIIQAGHIEKQSSHEIAQRIIARLHSPPQEKRP